jgi:lipopolysaccharide transport system ATP-binding protein
MELTGRENIYMNGTVLGMKKREIDHKFDEIVDFSGIERFLDTPVKRYSSGMRVRLGFSIAAHLEPEILVVDEVLAVGDLNFQKKCINKMEDVAGQGRTVLFVSHRMEAIRSLCGRCILINQGRLSTDGGVDEVVQQYYDAVRDRDITADLSASKENHRRGSGKARFSGCKVLNATGLESDHFEPGEDIVFQFDYKVFSPIDQLYIRIGLRSPRSGEFVTVTEPHLLSSKSLRPGEQGCRKLTFPSANLRLGDYPVYLWLGTADYEAYDVVDDLTQPLLIRSSKTTRELGYDVSKHSGFFDIQSVLDA